LWTKPAAQAKHKRDFSEPIFVHASEPDQGHRLCFDHTGGFAVMFAWRNGENDCF
jgi:hypothetical protein